MKSKVHISSFSVKAPGIDGEKDLYEAVHNKNFNAEFEKFYFDQSDCGTLGKIQFDVNSPHYPKRQDIKAMRDDVVAAVICIGELLEKAEIPDEKLVDIPLFVANGIFVEQLLSRKEKIAERFFDAFHIEDEADMYRRIVNVLPPIIALSALTNATESFVAQYGGIAGNNSTFGNTSHSAFYALNEGIKCIESGQNEMVVVGASSYGGIFSNLTFRNFSDSLSDWRESICAVFLMLESTESLLNRKQNPLNEIVQLGSSKHVPDLFKMSAKKYYEGLDINGMKELAVFSGGFTQHDYELEKEYVQTNWKDSFSWFPELGSFGACSMLMNIITAITLIEKGDSAKIDCLNRDPYSRESYVQIFKSE